MNPIALSFVIPAFNEADNLEPLCRRIEKTCRGEAIDRYEVILVENGSWDDSESIIRRLHGENPRIKMLQLSRNFGYQGAISLETHWPGPGGDKFQASVICGRNLRNLVEETV